MIVFVVTLIATLYLILWKMELHNGTGTIMGRATTDTLRGAAIMLILLHHASTSMDTLPKLFTVFSPLGAFGTAIFFFFSGYGNYFSINRKIGGGGYWVAKRISRIISSFLFVYALYFIILFTSGNMTYNFVKNIYSIFTLTLPGYTNWYIKIQLLVYVMHFITHKCCSNVKLVNGILFAELLLYTISMIAFGYSGFWWTSPICYVIGSVYADYIHDKSPHFKISQVITCIFMTLIFYITLFFFDGNIRSSFVLLFCVCGTISIFMLTSFVTLNSALMKMIGNISFELYLSQLIFISLILKTKLIRSLELKMLLYIVLSIFVGGMIYRLSSFFQRKVLFKKSK